ncbi:hypothetical protein [Castellaniella sp. GW247-6E4]|uniref:hypothetical protein n=1 Tax=Castellaniella sp. GW247-6E4 TaxID=3140380 RepID=UPI0033163167
MGTRHEAVEAKIQEELVNDESLRRTLGAEVLERLGGEITGVSAHIGEDYEEGMDPEAVVFRERKAGFRFLAFTFEPWRMWDLHVGVVATGADELSLGFHISERAAGTCMMRLMELGKQVGATVKHYPIVVEYQANLPPITVSAMKFETLVNTLCDVCRAMSTMAAGIEPPSNMRAST